MTEFNLDLPLIAEGKVRKMYQADEQHLIILTTDRISAFDVIMPTPIPEKGVILTKVANFWFEKLNTIIPNHLADISAEKFLSPNEFANHQNRIILVKKLKPLPIEAIVRGYIVGSGWNDYQKTGRVCGIDLPKGLKQAEKLSAPLYTPSTKANIGDHDENVSFEETAQLIGAEKAAQVRDISLALYQTAADFAQQRGIIIADTKFEFGEDENGKIHLIDEVLTPDSSRFWPVETYQTGCSPESFDKQFVRDYLLSLDWDKTPPGPTLPDDIVKKTAAKYKEVMEKLLS
jgi:phosphoribosylaminoimidazole-succinocarboxamide synthase